MINGNQKSKNIKKSITEPKFGKIFIKRFLVWLGVFSVIAFITMSELDNYTWNLRSENINTYRIKVQEEAKTLYEADPESEDYSWYQDRLKIALSIYQYIDYNYAEAQIGNLRFASDKDTAYTFLPAEGKEHNDIFFIEDISYFDPIDEYMDGKISYKRIVTQIDKYAYDPLIRLGVYMGLVDPEVDYTPKTLYINREKHTFIPGIVMVSYHGKTYEVDCTPADTKGFELYDAGDNYWLLCYYVSYRMDPDLSSKDISDYDVLDPDVNYYPRMIEKNEYNNDDNKYPITIGFNHRRELSFFERAPLTSVVIPVIDILFAAILALILSVIKYQRDKTVWKIFEYRIKTTEAMAHDLKTPLSTMMFYLENLEKSSNDPEKVLECKNNINDKVVAMDHMIGDILLLSKSESGKVNLTKEEVNVKTLVTECLKEFPGMKSEINGDDITLTTDKKVLAQVVMNLLSNCDRYGKEESAIDIAVSPDALTITNKTDKTYDDVDSLKKPFVKGEDSRGNKGAGVGLAIADNNLAMLGYKLELSSESDEFRARIKFKP
jgi:hypothetical protein